MLFTSTSRTKPSGPGKTWRILHTFHFPLIGFWSATMTELFTFTFLLWVLHFFRGMSWGRTSLYHLFQKATTIFWQNSSRWRGFSMWWNGPLGTLLVALPGMMSFGHKSSGSFRILPMGRSFNRFATSRRCRDRRGVRTALPMAFLRADFVDLTRASEHPFWCGARGVVNCHFMPLSAQYSLSLVLSHPSIIRPNSLSAPTICDPLSDNNFRITTVGEKSS